QHEQDKAWGRGSCIEGLRSRDSRQLPNGWKRKRRKMLCATSFGRRLWLRKLHPRIHRVKRWMGEKIRRQKTTYRRGRYQKPGRSDNCFRALVDLFLKRGVRVDESYQLNLGGDTDFL